MLATMTTRFTEHETTEWHLRQEGDMAPTSVPNCLQMFQKGEGGAEKLNWLCEKGGLPAVIRM